MASISGKAAAVVAVPALVVGIILPLVLLHAHATRVALTRTGRGLAPPGEVHGAAVGRHHTPRHVRRPQAYPLAPASGPAAAPRPVPARHLAARPARRLHASTRPKVKAHVSQRHSSKTKAHRPRHAHHVGTHSRPRHSRHAAAHRHGAHPKKGKKP